MFNFYKREYVADLRAIIQSFLFTFFILVNFLARQFSPFIFAHRMHPQPNNSPLKANKKLFLPTRKI